MESTAVSEVVLSVETGGAVPSLLSFGVFEHRLIDGRRDVHRLDVTHTRLVGRYITAAGLASHAVIAGRQKRVSLSRGWRPTESVPKRLFCELLERLPVDGCGDRCGRQ